MNVAALPTLAPWQTAANLTTVLEHIEMPPNQFLGMVVAKHQTPILGTSLRIPQPRSLFDLQDHGTLLSVKMAVDYFPAQPQSQQFMKQLLWCHPLTLQNPFHRKQRGTKNLPLSRCARRGPPSSCQCRA